MSKLNVAEETAPTESVKEEKIEPYHVEEGFRHLMEAEKVKNNPKLLEKVKAHAKKHGEALSAIQNLSEPGPSKSTKDLRDLRSKLSSKK